MKYVAEAVGSALECRFVYQQKAAVRELKTTGRVHGRIDCDGAGLIRILENHLRTII
jgi:hypothetical protein